MKGFTLIEILLVIIIILFCFGLIFPLGISFYNTEQLQATSQQILQTLRKAQLKAMSGQADSIFGVYFDNTNKKYILFKGSSYVPPGDVSDESFEFSSIITISGPSEVSFSKAEGKPNFTGNITLNSNGLISTININEIGRINLDL